MKDWVLTLLKSFGKRAALYLIDTEGKLLRDQLKKEVALKGAGVVDGAIDKLQDRLNSGIDALRFLPLVLKDQAKHAVLHYGDELQDSIKQAIKEKGAGGIDAAFDRATATLVAKINAL